MHNEEDPSAGIEELSRSLSKMNEEHIKSLLEGAAERAEREPEDRSEDIVARKKQAEEDKKRIKAAREPRAEGGQSLLSSRDGFALGGPLIGKILNSIQRKKLLGLAEELEFVDSPEPQGLKAADFKQEFKELVKESTPEAKSTMQSLSRDYDPATELTDMIDEYFAALYEGNNGEVVKSLAPLDKISKDLVEKKPRKKRAKNRTKEQIQADKEAIDYRGGESTDFFFDMTEADKARKLKRSQIPEGPHAFRQAFRKAWREKKETFEYEGKPYRVDEEIKSGREDYNEGGPSILVPPEMDLEEKEGEMPLDTYTPDEQIEAEQVPDDEMEEDHLDFILGESLDETEQEYLMNALESDPELSAIFDKVMDTASEFSGAGEVEGPGTGVSDSIPARLSDGEFVVTEKATEEIGSDNLQEMMDDAERKYDGGKVRLAIGGLLDNPEDPQGSTDGYSLQDEDEEIHKSMLASNRMPSVAGSRR